MEASILQAHPEARVELIPGGGGTFLVHADGKKIWDKLADNSDFPDGTALAASL
ncbi:MAG: hypothetical protein GY930_11475 [bacterium]|nr:hypothetical protein [bacterium]